VELQQLMLEAEVEGHLRQDQEQVVLEDLVEEVLVEVQMLMVLLELQILVVAVVVLPVLVVEIFPGDLEVLVSSLSAIR